MIEYTLFGITFLCQSFQRTFVLCCPSPASSCIIEVVPFRGGCLSFKCSENGREAGNESRQMTTPPPSTKATLWWRFLRVETVPASTGHKHPSLPFGFICSCWPIADLWTFWLWSG
ncbi:hypothetical protein Ddc_04360 [Ditylenchus destructor]|nr:hypothetical protein Ddc_04360 [Ditylenchus destructor]